MPIILSEPIKKFYHANYISLTFVSTLLVLILTLVLTYLIVYITGDFMISVITDFKEPIFDYQNQYILSVTDDDNLVKSYSSIIKFNENYANQLSVPLTVVNKVDNNEDDTIEALNLNIKFNSKPKKIRNIKLLFFFKYGFMYKGYLFSIDSFGIIDVDAPYGISFLKAYGDIEFKQKSPITFSSLNNIDSIGELITNSTSPLQIDELKWIQSVKNFTTSYNYQYYIEPFSHNKATELDISIEMSSFQEILFEAPYLYIIKNMWIQYFSVLVPVGIASFLFLYLLYKMGVFLTIQYQLKIKAI